jgi:hypothetical protein
MPKIDEKTRAELRVRLAAGDYQAATEHNRRVQLLAPEGKCGGCYGAGTGPRCRICGGRR